MVAVSMGEGHALGGPTEHPQPNTALHLTAYSAPLVPRSGFRQRLRLSVRR